MERLLYECVCVFVCCVHLKGAMSSTAALKKMRSPLEKNNSANTQPPTTFSSCVHSCTRSHCEQCSCQVEGGSNCCSCHSSPSSPCSSLRGRPISLTYRVDKHPFLVSSSSSAKFVRVEGRVTGKLPYELIFISNSFCLGAYPPFTDICQKRSAWQ